jgi:plastin-1
MYSHIAWVVSTLDTEGTGAITKANAISALQNSGEGSYDQVREVLKGVSIDASGKVELEDWVEVRCIQL